MYRNLSRLGFALALTCVVTILNAQWRGLRSKQLGPSEGLNMRVNMVVQGPNGFVYMGGTQGLVRYDGSEFDLFAHNPDDTSSIGSGEVYNLIVASDSLIWIGLRYGGLNSFNPRTGNFRRYPLPKLPYFMTPTAHGLLEDENGCLWVGGHHFQLLCFDRESESFTSYQPDWINPGQYGRRLSIISILQDVRHTDLLWLSVIDYEHEETRGGYGMVSFNKRLKTFTSYPNSGVNTFQDSVGNLYGVRVVNGVSKYAVATDEASILPFKVGKNSNFMSRSLLPVGDKYWMNTGDAILRMDDKGAFELLYRSQAEHAGEFNRMSMDDAENVWIANTQGVTIVNQRDQNIRYFSLDQFDARDRIYPGRLAYDPGNDLLYLSYSIGISNKRIYRIPLNESHSGPADFIETEHDMYGLAVDANGQLWLTGNGQMYRLNAKKGVVIDKTHLFDEVSIPWVWNMRTSTYGWIGAVGRQKFMWFHPEGENAREVDMQDLPVWSGVASYDKDFIGFSFSPSNEYAYLLSSVVHRLDLKSGDVGLLHFNINFNPNGQPLSDAIEDSEGTLWIAGVEFMGRYKIEGDSLILIEKYTVQNGLASSEIHELFSDRKGRIWLFTTNGINCIDPESGEVRYFGVNEGLPQIYIDPRQVIETPDGRIVTVNKNGIIVFHPDLLWNSLSPQQESIAIKAIRINGVDISSDLDVNYLSTISAPLGKNVIDIRFQGLAYPDDSRLIYSYRLSEEEDWIDIGQNKLVTLPALSSGDYIFEVKAGAPSSVAPVRRLQIHIPTPYYLQAWFIGVAILLMVVAIYLSYKYRVNSIRSQEEAKTEVNKRMAELELKALRSQINPHFMFNSLNSIKDFILQANTEKAAEYLSDFAHLIRRILQHSREKVISLKDELETLVLYVDLEQLRFENAFDFNCIVDDDIELEEVQIPPMLLQPYIENAIWHGLMHMKEKGNLTLKFSRKDESVSCVIDDDGIGRDRARELKSLSAVRYKSMGMGITKDRIEILNRMSSLGISVVVDDKVDSEGNPSGTRVTLSIPA